VARTSSTISYPRKKATYHAVTSHQSFIVYEAFIKRPVSKSVMPGIKSSYRPNATDMSVFCVIFFFHGEKQVDKILKKHLRKSKS